MSIDWSKAPERAVAALIANAKNVHYPSVTYVSGYHRTGCMIRATAASDGSSLSAPDEFWSIEDKPIAWNGEGLPPVGVECEANMPPNGMRKEYEWRLVKVVHGGIPGAEREVLVFDVENTYPAWVDEFRPIRTPEQIAAEEREKSVVEMEQLIAGATTWQEALRRIYDAGYRLVEGGAQ